MSSLSTSVRLVELEKFLWETVFLKPNLKVTSRFFCRLIVYTDTRSLVIGLLGDPITRGVVFIRLKDFLRCSQSSLAREIIVSELFKYLSSRVVREYLLGLFMESHEEFEKIMSVVEFSEDTSARILLDEIQAKTNRLLKEDQSDKHILTAVRLISSSPVSGDKQMGWLLKLLDQQGLGDVLYAELLLGLCRWADNSEVGYIVTASRFFELSRASMAVEMLTSCRDLFLDPRTKVPLAFLPILRRAFKHRNAAPLRVSIRSQKPVVGLDQACNVLANNHSFVQRRSLFGR